MKRSPFHRIGMGLFAVATAAGVALAQPVEVYDPAADMGSRYGYEEGLGAGLRRGLGMDSDAAAVTQEVPELFWVRGGQLVYCAHCGQLLKDTVAYMQVSAAQARDYYDDGTHGDVFPNDGVPTNIVEERNTYIGPYSYHSKMTYQEYIKRAREMGAREFYQVDAGTYKIHEDRTYRIPPDSSGVDFSAVEPLDESEFPSAAPAQLTSMPEVDARLREFLNEFEGIVDDIFKDFLPHRDDIRNVPIGRMSPVVVRAQFAGMPGALMGQPGMAGPYGHTIGRARGVAAEAEAWQDVRTPVIP